MVFSAIVDMSGENVSFVALFSDHTCPSSNPPSIPQTRLDAYIQNFPDFQQCIGWGARYFQKVALFYEGTQKLQKIMNTASLLGRTFVHDCNSW